MEEKYTCENCGSEMIFDVASQALKCQGCGAVIQIKNNSKDITEHPLTLEAKQRIRAGEKKSHTMECQGCGARIEVDAHSTATQCPYCGSRYVLADKQEDVIIPDGVVPFQIDNNRVGELFRQWLKSRWLAPGSLKNMYQTDKVQGIYLPYWTFDAHAEADYTGRGGRHRTRTVQNSDGKTVTQVYTEWHRVAGHIRHFFDDILIPATNSLSLEQLEKIADFDTGQIASYGPEYLSGYNSECFSVDLEISHQKARHEMLERLESMARNEILSRYDEADSIHIQADFREESFKHVLLPVYSTAYMFKDKVYQVLVNGQTGDITGKYPLSPAKIALICAAMAVIVILIILFVIS